MHKAKFGQNSPLDWRDAKIPGSADSEFKVWNQNSNSTSRESKSVTDRDTKQFKNTKWVLWKSKYSLSCTFPTPNAKIYKF